MVPVNTSLWDIPMQIKRLNNIPNHSMSWHFAENFQLTFLKNIKLHKKPPIKQSFTPLFAQMLSVIMSTLKVRKQRFSYGDL